MAASPETVNVEVWVCVDGAGDYHCGTTDASARENYETDVQPLADAEGFRLVKVTITVPLPEVVELTGSAPAHGEATLVNVQ